MASWVRVGDCAINLAMLEQIEHSMADGPHFALLSHRCDTLVSEAHDSVAYTIIRGFLLENVIQPVGAPAEIAEIERLRAELAESRDEERAAVRRQIFAERHAR